MKKIFLVIIILAAVFSFGCGKTSSGNELIGQVKKVNKNTPLFCPNYSTADVSLGAMQNGVGSMSTQDVWVVVSNQDLPKFQQAVETGKLVKVKYDVERFVICTESQYANSIEFVP